MLAPEFPEPDVPAVDDDVGARLVEHVHPRRNVADVGVGLRSQRLVVLVELWNCGSNPFNYDRVAF